MEHVKRTIESDVARESLKLEGGLILLAIAVSGAPFIGLLGTVWGVMSTFTNVAMLQTASLPVMAPGVAAALGLVLLVFVLFCYWLYDNVVGIDNMKLG